MNTLHLWLTLSVFSLLICQISLLIILIKLNGRVEELEAFNECIIEWAKKEVDTHGEEE